MNRQEPLSKNQIKEELDKNLDEFENAASAEYDKYFESGKMYLSTFKMSVDVEDLDSPSPSVLEYVYEKWTNLTALVVSATAIYIGYKLTVAQVSGLGEKLQKMLQTLKGDNKVLGMFLAFIGIFIIGLRTLTAEQADKRVAMAYMAKIGGVRNVMSALSSEMISMSKEGQFSLTSLLKKILLSILSILDLAVSTFKRIIQNAVQDRYTQLGIVVFMIGIILVVK